jgi:hypothetical protein
LDRQHLFVKDIAKAHSWKVFRNECTQANVEDALKRALKALQENGFVFACLPTGPDDGPPPDFTMFLPHCGDCRSLVVCAPVLTEAQADHLFNCLPSRQFADGTRIEVGEPPLWPDESCLKPSPIMLSNVVAVANPPFVPAGFVDQSPWISAADLKITRAGAESQLRVVHLGSLTREESIWRFLVPHGLVPRKVIL